MFLESNGIWKQLNKCYTETHQNTLNLSNLWKLEKHGLINLERDLNSSKVGNK